MLITRLRAFFVGFALIGMVATPYLAPGQVATAAQKAGVKPDPKFGTLHLQANVGSFRSIDGVGRFEINFKGTILITNPGKGTKIETSAGLKQEYKDSKRQSFFGAGRIVITGSWRVVQWFGREMTAVWYGQGAVQLTGEFDQDLNTGTYWYDNPSSKVDWFSMGVVTITVPAKPIGTGGPAPRERKPESKPPTSGH